MPVTMKAGGVEAEAAQRELPFARLPVTLPPDRSLLTYYMLGSLLFGPFFIFAMIPAYFRYHTLRYDIDEQGITMRWGILFRREVSLTYARIQDIQLSSNLVERWLGLAKIQLQTASGSSSAEMTIEGMREVDALRDFLYARTRGAGSGAPAASQVPSIRSASPDIQELTEVLNAVAAELRALRLERTATARGADDD
ncbi:MAG TPA: PH domain-containing protein [Longimicrobiales bacterium]|nr:PH domain-containing protein [Longimicrobiales bacterium]